MSSKDQGLKKISNPPFKPFLDYRIGDYNTFRKVMLRMIKKNRLLRGASVLKSDKKDYGASLVDMWAYLCDILTYYQERIASESFLRTARLEESIIELLYLVDYLPQKGRSASTLVRFVTNEKNVGPPPPPPPPPHTEESPVIIPKGFKIISVPGKGQEAIIFETDESLIVSSDHNLMKLSGWRTSFKIERGTTQLFLDKVYPELNIGDLVIINDNKNTEIVRIAKKVDKDGKSQITWAEDKPLSSDYDLSKTKVHKFTQVVRPFGYNAPPSILSNVGLTLYGKKFAAPSDNNNGRHNNDNNSDNGNSGEERELVTERLVQLIDASDRVAASASSDKDGKITFKGLIPGSYRFFIARSGELKDESQLNTISTISTNRFQLLPGFESWFDAELDLGGEGGGAEQTEFFANTVRALSNWFREDRLIGRGLNNVAAINNNPIFPGALESLVKDTESDKRPGLNLTAKEPHPFDPVNEDILSSKVYLDKVYGNINQGSVVILSKDDPSDEIDISRQLFKVSRTGQMFHAKYGIGGNASTINLQSIDDKEEEIELIFCWEEILQEIPEVKENNASSEREGGGGEEEEEKGDPGKQTKQLIDFLNRDINALDPKTDRPITIDGEETAIQISDQNQKNVYRIKLEGKDKERKATLFKDDKKMLDFIVESREEDKKTNLYARKIESSFYKIRNTLIFTNPVMEIGVDPRYASHDRTDQHTENITLEGMHTGLSAGAFLGITDNTAIIKGKVVDSNLNPLEGYRVTIYRIQKLEPSLPTSSVSMTAAPIEVISGHTDKEGSFSFDDLRPDSYVLSLSLSLEKYWPIFVDYIYQGEEVAENNNHHRGREGNRGGGNEKREIINALLLPLQYKKKEINSSAKGRNNSSKEVGEGEKPDHKLAELAKRHLDVFRELIAIIRRRKEGEKPLHLESRFAVYISDILHDLLEVELSILPLINAESDKASSFSSFSSSSTALLDRSLAESIKLIEQEPEAKLKQLKSKVQQVLGRLPNDRSSTSISFVRDFIEKTTIPIITILEEILIIVKESLQSPFRLTTYQENERQLGITKPLDLESDTATNITMTFNIKDKLTYVESKLQHSKFQVTKIAGAPTFRKGKTNLILNPPLKYSYVKGFAEIYGNIAPASHGETVKDEILGSGNAAAIHQEFTLRKGPISYVPSPLSPNGIQSTLKVIVNDVLWQETDDFLSSSPNDQHYVTSLNEDGSIKITFGDGIRGSTLPTGVDNVHAQYRVGLGFKGNLPPNTPVVPQENNPAIKSVSIPAGSYGGAEKILSQQKRNYRPHILTLGRAVSLDDYSNLATTFGEISKARAYLAMKDGRETVVLVVAGQGGRIVNSALQMELQAYLDERRDISVPLEIESFVPVPVDIVVEVKVNDNYRRSTVVSNIQTRLAPGILYDKYHNKSSDNGGEVINYRLSSTSASNSGSNIGIQGNGIRGFSLHFTSLFSFERLNFGQKVTLNDVYAVVQNVTGVDFALVRKFCRRDQDVTTAVQEMINVNHNEILQCENDPLDPIRGTLKVIARGGMDL